MARETLYLNKMKLQQIKFDTKMKDLVKGLDDKPGIYIFSEDDKILYVGKARSLKKRVSSYMNISRLDNKGRRLMEKANRLQWVIASSNTEALLLEYNFIKKHRPPYNIMLRDDKSYPFVYLSGNHKFPMLAKHRGAQKKPGKYFGPFPNTTAVNRSITEMQKIFQIRSCSDSFFNNRKRPCLQHQIGRCSAPCVGGISEEDYAKNISFVGDFLAGKDDKVIKELTKDMEQASAEMRFENAAELRDKVRAMRNLGEKQYISKNLGDLDALSVYSHGDNACIYIIRVRKGKLSDSSPFFFRAPAFDNEDGLLPAFITQFYMTSDVPSEIITTAPVPREVFDDLEEHHKRRITYKHIVRGTRRHWLRMAAESCKSLLINHINTKYTFRDDFEELGRKFGVPRELSRIECFDISHSAGRQTQASCVVFNPEGPSKKEYRRFNIDNITPGDDYAAIRQAVMRRYKKMEKQEEGMIILIDGGMGQVNSALRGLRQIYKEAKEKKDVMFLRGAILIGVAKDRERKFGKEKILALHNKDIQGYLYSPSGYDISDRISTMELNSLSRRTELNLLLKVRDEAHRFAISGHRKKRTAAALRSDLDGIQGIGESRKGELIRYFGGVARIKDASLEELACVPGFGKKLAEVVFDQLHN